MDDVIVILFFPLFYLRTILMNCFPRYFTEGLVDPIAVTAGIVQTGLYIDFFYVYFTKYVSACPIH